MGNRRSAGGSEFFFFFGNRSFTFQKTKASASANLGHSHSVPDFTHLTLTFLCMIRELELIDD